MFQSIYLFPYIPIRLAAILPLNNTLPQKFLVVSLALSYKPNLLDK